MDTLSEYQYFCQKVQQLTGFDLSSYKPNQMVRRLGTLMGRNRVSSFTEYFRLLERDAERRREFIDFLTINVSEFFRNPGRFDFLKERVITELAAGGTELKVWSAGCSTGEEPYSVAMILDELGVLDRAQIHATDVDEQALEQAAGGWYEPLPLRNVSTGRLDRYFFRDGDNYRVVDRIRQAVSFRRHDLLKDAYGSGYDLILCRNVVIYFTESSKERIYRLFRAALKPGGYLFTGGTETILGARELGLTSVSPCFYRKATGTAPREGRK